MGARYATSLHQHRGHRGSFHHLGLRRIAPTGLEISILSHSAQPKAVFRGDLFGPGIFTYKSRRAWPRSILEHEGS